MPETQDPVPTCDPVRASMLADPAHYRRSSNRANALGDVVSGVHIGMQQPLTVAIIVGLLIQMPLVLLFTPTPYTWMTGWSKAGATPDSVAGHRV